MLFATSVSPRFDAVTAPGWPAMLVMAGGVLAAAGVTIGAGILLALSDGGETGNAAAVQSLHILNEDMFFPMAVGVALLGLGIGSGILKTGILPKPLGYLAIAGGVLVFSPPSFIGPPLMALTILIVSLALAAGSARPPDRPLAGTGGALTPL